MSEWTPLDVNTNIQDGDWSDLPQPTLPGALIRIGLLRNGTSQGRAVVAMAVRLEDGSTVLVQTTWRLMRTAVAALEAGPVGSEEVHDDV